MSTATISYASLRNASTEAKSVARKLTAYADNLNSCVYRKLNNYSGNHTGNIQTAKGAVNNKISYLREKSMAYTNYANDLYDLKEKCSDTDRSVKSLVSSLTATFKENHGIKNSSIQNSINYFLTSMKNSNFIGRWLTGASDKENSIKDYIRQTVKNWWGYEGGKQLAKGLLEAALDVAIAICTVLAVSLTGGVWAVIVGVAALIGAGILIGNSVVNIVNEFRAYHETHDNENPALGRRRSDEDTLQDTIRRETDSKGWHNVASAIDGINLACAVISIGDGIKNVFKNGFKFIKEKKLFSKDFWTNMGSKFKNGFKDIRCSWKMDFTSFKDFGSRLKSNFIYNLNKNFHNFGSIKDGAKTVKNYLGITKSFVKDGINVENVKDVVLKKIVLPCTTIFTVNKDNPGFIGFMGDQIQIDMYDHVTAGNLSGIFDGINSKIIKSDLFSDGLIKAPVLDKLAQVSAIDISVPRLNTIDFQFIMA